MAAYGEAASSLLLSAGMNSIKTAFLRAEAAVVAFLGIDYGEIASWNGPPGAALKQGLQPVHPHRRPPHPFRDLVNCTDQGPRSPFG